MNADDFSMFGDREASFITQVWCSVQLTNEMWKLETDIAQQNTENVQVR